MNFIVMSSAVTPGQPKVWMSFAHVLKTVGEQDEAIAAYRKAIELAPSLGEVWWSLANLKTVKFGDSDVAAMEAALDDAALNADDKLHLNFALGKAWEDRNEIEKAWHHYEEGNRIRAAQLRYDPDRISGVIDRSIALMTAEFFEQRQGQGCNAPDPIFILGMPRAGSTLLEQILASHSQIEGTMELPDIHAIVRRIDGHHARDERGNYPEALLIDRRRNPVPTRPGISRSNAYPTQPGQAVFHRQNAEQLGLCRIYPADPSQREDHRCPASSARLLLFQLQAALRAGPKLQLRSDHTGRYYADYVRFMAHLDTVQPGKIYRVIHDRLVDDPEAEIRSLLEYCGVEWEDACLRFHETKRAVRTASSEQVRQPLSRSGFDQWKPFQRWLNPLKDALGPRTSALG